MGVNAGGIDIINVVFISNELKFSGLYQIVSFTLSAGQLSGFCFFLCSLKGSAAFKGCMVRIKG